jgi:peptidoglycan/xylan/chitin deacetylase (PgdA/CDA1 family)
MAAYGRLTLDYGSMMISFPKISRLVLAAALASATCAAHAAQPSHEPEHPHEVESFAPPAEMGTVALTFDDLPGLSLTADQPYVDYINMMILRGLKKHHFPAIGFVNESKLDRPTRDQQVNNLKRWLNAGMDLGNHTYSHESPNDLGAERYTADIAKGEPVTKGLLAQHGKTMRYFRHPYLETGSPGPVKDAIDSWLATHGYIIAPVTIDADDWEFAQVYDDAIYRHDEPRRLQVQREYLAYTERTIGWYQRAAHAVFGRQIAYVMLLHDTRLNADSFEALAQILQRRRLKPVTLEQALKDPAYRTRDPYTGKDGIDWVERWSDELHKTMPWSTWQDPPKRIEDEYEKTEHDRH